MNKAQLERKMHNDGLRRVRYFNQRENDVEFHPPEENHSNRMLSNDAPLDPEFNLRSVFYIPNKEHKNLIQIFNDHQIPEHMWPDLTWTYLNMCFAAGNALWSDNYHRNLQSNQKENFELLDLLEEILNQKKILRGFTLETRNVVGEQKYGPLTAKKFKGYVSAQFLEKILYKYKELSDYKIAKQSYDHLKENGFSDMVMGYKNHEKHKQSYYSNVIFDFLRQELFRPAYDLLNEWDKFAAIHKKMNRQYSRNKRFLFIGKLMLLSGLISSKKEMIDTEIIDLIKKKLATKLQNEKKSLRGIRERNNKSTDGRYEAINVTSYF